MAGISLAGLSATYPGYAAQQEQDAKTAASNAEASANQGKARDAALKLLGAGVLGKALMGGDQGPQAPPPGQASMPAPRPMPPPAPTAAIPPQAAAVPQGGLPPSPQPPPAVSAPAGGGAPPAAPQAGGAAKLPEISLQGLTQRILETSPGIRNHPEVFLAALEHAKPFLDQQSKADLQEIQQNFTLQRIQMAKDRLDYAKQAHEDALKVHAQVSQDRGAARDVANDRLDTVRAAQDIKQQQLERQKARDAAAAAASPAGAAPAGASNFAAPPAVTGAPNFAAPPAAMLKPNTITTFANGQRWTLGPDGQPKQVQ